MALAIVDPLELVQVDRDQRRHRPVALAAGLLGLQQPVPGAAVADPGERVGEGVQLGQLEPALQLLALQLLDQQDGQQPPEQLDRGQLGGQLRPAAGRVDPESGRPELAAELPTIELLGRMLAVLLVQELERQELQRRFELAELDALTDPLTGVGNRRAWDRLLDAEEARCRRYGSVASLVAIDLDELKRVNDGQGHAAGDRLLRRTAQVIDSCRRAADMVARLGGDEFGVLAVECDEPAAKVLADRFRGALEAAGIRASVGHATRQPTGTLAQAWSAADARMYAQKRGIRR